MVRSRTNKSQKVVGVILCAHRLSVAEIELHRRAAQLVFDKQITR
jgi:hypothetical protein